MMQLSIRESGRAAAMLKMDGLNLLLPQRDIRTLESASDMDRSAPALNSPGWVPFQHKRWPAYCLSENLELMDEMPPDRRACVMFSYGGGFTGILCNDVIVLKDFDAPSFELPAAMRLPDTPITGLIEYAEGIACVSNAARLTSYVGMLVANE